jgi:hypothetical protein
MPAPTNYEYSVDAIEAAHQSLLDLIDSGAGAGIIRFRDNSDVLLGTITLTDPAGTINVTTGQLTLTAASTSSAVATGTCTYGEICNSTGTVYLAIPTEAGTSPVSGKLVINSLSIVSGAVITLVSATIG